MCWQIPPSQNSGQEPRLYHFRWRLGLRLVHEAQLDAVDADAGDLSDCARRGAGRVVGRVGRHDEDLGHCADGRAGGFGAVRGEGVRQEGDADHDRVRGRIGCVGEAVECLEDGAVDGASSEGRWRLGALVCISKGAGI